MQSNPRLRVAICGGGIGGLTLAVVLGKYSEDIQIDLYEAKSEFTATGAGISVWKRSWHIMQLLGLDVSLTKTTVKPPVDEPSPGYILRKGDQKGGGLNFYQMVVPCKSSRNVGSGDVGTLIKMLGVPFYHTQDGSISLYRADILAALSDNLPHQSGFRVHFHKRLVAYEQQTSDVLLAFSDSTIARADILVGADGIKSAARATMYNQLADNVQDVDPVYAQKLKGFLHASWTGTYAYRTVVDTSRVLCISPAHQAAKNPIIYLGKNKHIVSYPMLQDRFINLIPFASVNGGEAEELSGRKNMGDLKQEMIEHFKDWEPEVRNLIECVETPSRWAIQHIRGLPQYIDGRVALLGDAAHAMSTHLGAGAGQAIEDAYILGRLLSEPSVTTTNIPAILKVYEDIRLPVANSIVERSLETGFYYEFNRLPDFIDPEKVEEGSREELEKLAAEIYNKWELHWGSLPDDDWRKAENLLQQVLVTAKVEMNVENRSGAVE